MEIKIDVGQVAEVLAQNDTAEKFRSCVTISPEDMPNIFGDTLSPMEFYQKKYDHYFEILLAGEI